MYDFVYDEKQVDDLFAFLSDCQVTEKGTNNGSRVWCIELIRRTSKCTEDERAKWSKNINLPSTWIAASESKDTLSKYLQRTYRRPVGSFDDLTETETEKDPSPGHLWTLYMFNSSMDEQELYKRMTRELVHHFLDINSRQPLTKLPMVSILKRESRSNIYHIEYDFEDESDKEFNLSRLLDFIRTGLETIRPSVHQGTKCSINDGLCVVETKLGVHLLFCKSKWFAPTCQRQLHDLLTKWQDHTSPFCFSKVMGGLVPIPGAFQRGFRVKRLTL